jgi:pimeloyl-ACP methyl ester carboxylesterase
MAESRSLYPVCAHGAGRHKIHVSVWNQDAKGRPLFCVHALTRVAGDFESLANAFPDRPVYAPEMAGRGQSPWLLDSHLYGLPHYVDDCLQVMDQLQLGTVDWLGTSMGGLIGMMVAATHPQRIRKIILNDVGPFLPLAGVKRIASYLGLFQRFSDMEQAIRYCRTVYGGFGLTSDEAWRKFTERSVVQNEDGSYRLSYDPRIADLFGIIDRDVNLWPIYEMIKCPTLVLRGAQSDVLLEKDARDMTNRGPQAKLVTFENVAHAPALESDAQIAVVKEFLDT